MKKTDFASTPLLKARTPATCAIASKGDEVVDATLRAAHPVSIARVLTQQVYWRAQFGDIDAFRKLLADIGEAPREVTISARRAWRVKLAGGMTLDLGRERVEERLERFVAAWPRTIARMGRRVEHADLRYPNGFAVRIPELRNDKDKGGGAPEGTRPAPATGKAPA